MRKAIVVAVPITAALAVGASGFAFAPAVCACHSGPQVVAGAAGRAEAGDWRAAAALRAREIEPGLRKNLIGYNPDPRSLFPSALFGCTAPAGPIAECYVETGKSWLFRRGWLIQIERAETGTITGVRAHDVFALSP